MKTFGHTRPVRDPSGAVAGRRPAPALRATEEPLGAGFGPDKHRRLVVSLVAGDLIVFRPERLREGVTIRAVDAYRWALQCKAEAERTARRKR